MSFQGARGSRARLPARMKIRAREVVKIRAREDVVRGSERMSFEDVVRGHKRKYINNSLTRMQNPDAGTRAQGVFGPLPSLSDPKTRGKEKKSKGPAGTASRDPSARKPQNFFKTRVDNSRRMRASPSHTPIRWKLTSSLTQSPSRS